MQIKSSTSSSVTLSWGAIANVKSYTLQYKKSGATSWTNVGIRGTETSYTLSGLSNTVYVFRLRANGDGGATCKSSEFSAERVRQMGTSSSAAQPNAFEDLFEEFDEDLLTALAENWN